MSKKTLLFFSIVLLIILLLLIFFIFINNLKPSTPPVGNIEISPVPVSTRPSQKINISGIQTNDFLSNPIKTNLQGDVLFAKTKDYQITYLRQFGEFIINVSTSSAMVRDDAESEFLRKLGITKEEACRLKVFVSVPYIPNPNLSIEKRTLSFCQ